MDVQVDLSKVVPANQIRGEDDEETVQLNEMLREATLYITSFTWCSEIKESYMGIGIGKVVAVFLFRIQPARVDVDEWVWVIVGDIPPAYITAENAPNPATALDGYIGAMQKWIEAVKQRKPVEDLIPVNIPPTPEWAEALERRLKFFDEKILINYQEDLKE